MKKLLVLDLDETLVHATETPLGRDPDFKVFDYFVYRRPYLSEFLGFCAAHFAVGIWSSAGDEYVDAIVQHIFPDPTSLVISWGVSRTTIRRTHPRGHGRSGQSPSDFHYLKRLQKLKRYGWSLDDMLIVDDSPEKCAANFGNAIYPAPYLGRVHDDELRYLASYLFSLKDSDRIRRIEKRGWRSSTTPIPW